MHRIFDLPYAAAQRLLQSGAPVFVPVNPVEFHGPHLSLHNDHWVSMGMIRELHQRMTARHDWPLLLAHDLELGVEPAPGPGSRPVPHRWVRGTIESAARALARMGAQKVVFMTFHGNPWHSVAIEAGVRWLQRQGVRATSPFNLLAEYLLGPQVEQFLDCYDPVTDLEARALLIREMPYDFHAGFLETSLALHFAPETVSPDYVDLPPCPPYQPMALPHGLGQLASRFGFRTRARELNLVAWGLGWTNMPNHPGYTSRPALARAECGARFAEHIFRVMVPHVSAVLDGEAKSPAPVMGWLNHVRFAAP